MSIALVMAILISALLGAVVGVAISKARQADATVAVELHFARGLDEASVSSFLIGVRGLLPPWWRRWLSLPYVVLEAEGNNSGIMHRLYVEERWWDVVE